MKSVGSYERVCVSVLLCILMAAPAAAQRATGSIAGRLLDDTGDPVSGATVTARIADGSIVRRDISGVDGRYRLGVLPAGTYGVAVRRLGYRPTDRANVTVRTGGTTDLQIVVGRAATALDPVRVGATPNEIRRDDTRLGTRIEEIELGALPIGYDFQSIIAFTPGARPDQVWGGSTEQANSYVMDGVALNHPGVGGSLLSLNPSWLTELEVTGLGGGAEMGNFQGGLIRAVTKSGSNTRTGYLRLAGESHRLNDSNIGSTEVAAEVAGRREVEGELRGPVIRDRLFYYLSGQLVKRDLRVLDHLRGEDAPARFLPTMGEHQEHKLFGKLSWQASARDNVDISAGRIGLSADHYGQTGFEAPAAAYRLDAPTNFYNLGWKRSWGTTAILDVRAAHMNTDERRDPYAGEAVPGILTWEIGGDRAYQNAPFRHHLAPRTTAFSANVDISATTGVVRHNWKIGGEVSMSRYLREQLRNGGMTWRPSPAPDTFDPERPVTWPRTSVIPLNMGGEVRLGAEIDNGALYVQDRLELGSRLSLLLGLRSNWWRGALRPFADRTQKIEAVRDFATEPRVGAIFDITGDGRTVAKAHAGRYHQHLFAQFFDRVEGGGVFTNEQFWYYDGPVPADPGEAFTDAQRAALIAGQRLRLVQEERLNEEGPVYNYRQPYMDQVVLGLERAIGSRWKAEAVYVGRRNKRLVALVDRNLATNFTAFENMAVLDRFNRPILDQFGAPLVLPVVYIPNDAIVNWIRIAAGTPGAPRVPNFTVADIPNLPYDPDYAITTAPGAERVFDQGQLTVTGRFPLWSVSGSLAVTKLEGNLFSVAGYDDPSGRGAGPYVRPNEAINAYGKLPNVADVEAKLRISGALPFGLRGGAFVTAMTGDRTTPSFTHSGLLFNLRLNDAPPPAREDTAFIPVPLVLPIAGQRVLLEQRGLLDYPSRFTLDLHLERIFPLRGVEIVVSADGFNVLGERAVTEANTTVDALSDPNATGPYGSPRARVAPRTFRLGTSVRF